MMMEEENITGLETGMNNMRIIKDDMSSGQGMEKLTRQFMQLRVSWQEWSGMEREVKMNVEG